MEEITYDKIKEEFKTSENGKYAHLILEKEDIKLQYGYLIFDVENKDKNKTLDAIAMCKNLGEDYKKTCHWLVQNTGYWPGSMRLELKLFVIDRKNKITIVFSSNKKDDFIIPFEYTENKEDSVLQAITLKYSRDRLKISNIYSAFKHYYDMDAILIEFKKKAEHIFDELTKLEISQ